MHSPFPGMDPFIEACGLWGDFHTRLIYKIGEALADAVPERYLVRSGERSYVVLIESEGKATYPFIPDVSVAGRSRRKKVGKKGSTAMAEASAIEPVEMCAFIEDEHREAFVDIYEADPAQRLVTSLEVLSPSNKRPSTPGWDLYQRKRQSVLLGGANLVEIDLLRGGQRMPMFSPWPDCPYTLLVARAKRPQNCKVWPVTVRQPLPPLPVPLAKPDRDVLLHLQPMIAEIYQRFHYDRTIDYTRPLTPPLGQEDGAWLKQQLLSRPGRK